MIGGVGGADAVVALRVLALGGERLRESLLGTTISGGSWRKGEGGKRERERQRVC
jgi:hypothetical protein